MKIKASALALTAVFSCCSLSGCALFNGSPEGEYCPIGGVTKNYTEEFLDDIDDGLEEVKEDGEDSDTSKWGNIILEDGEFTCYMSDIQFREYTGTFSENDGEICFEYETLSYENADGEKTKVDVDDEPETRTAKFQIEQMEEMNDSGTYINSVKPALYYNDRTTDFGMLPYFIVSNPGTERAAPVMLRHVENFLCVETYGMELDGRYKRGKDFVIEFDVMAPYTDDKYSYVPNGENALEREEFIERRGEYISQCINCDDFDTTIEFSDGEWEWYNDDGNLINNGEYQESQEYEGLIEMYVTDDSEKTSKYADTIMPVLFYISDDGEIYYPGFIKLN